MSTRSTLERMTPLRDDSLGRRATANGPQLSPVADPRDADRRASRDFGTIPLAKLMPDPDQPRVEFDEAALEQLAHSIREQGQLHPIRVRWSDDHQCWLIISGERRYRAAQAAGLETIECYFHEGELTQTEVLEQQLIENLLRSDLRPLEEARAFQQLQRLNAWTGQQLAQALRIHGSRVSRALALLKLPADIQQQVDAGHLSPTAAYELSKLSRADQQRAALKGAGAESPTVAQAHRQIRQRRGMSGRKAYGVKQTFEADDGWKVLVTCRRKGNYHELKQALETALAEVQLRIDNNVVLS